MKKVKQENNLVLSPKEYFEIYTNAAIAVRESLSEEAKKDPELMMLFPQILASFSDGLFNGFAETGQEKFCDEVIELIKNAK